MPEGFKLRSERPQAPLTCQPFHTWISPGGAAWTEFFRFKDHYLLRFPGLADFVVASPSLEVECCPVNDASPQTTEHLFINLVLPLVLSKQGRMVFHASVIEIDGAAVAFVGESGRGKSTLAAGFAMAGYPFLTDDALVVDVEDGDFFALPSHPSIRLWDDSEQALLPPDPNHSLPVSFTEKGRFLADDHLLFCPVRRPLRRVYFLGAKITEEVDIQAIKSSAALIEWVKHSFLLDIEDRPLLASHFGQVGTLARQPLHYRLEYPRQYDQLERVLNTIVDHASG